MKLSFISLWPLLLIWFGLSSGSSRRADGGSPMASGVLITYGIIFMLCEVLGWQLMQYIWPGFRPGFGTIQIVPHNRLAGAAQ